MFWLVLRPLPCIRAQETKMLRIQLVLMLRPLGLNVISMIDLGDINIRKELTGIIPALINMFSR